MRQKPEPVKSPAEQIVKDIRRATRRHFSAEEKIRVVLEVLRGEESIAGLCRRQGIASSMYYGWSKEFLEAGVGASVSRALGGLGPSLLLFLEGLDRGALHVLPGGFASLAHLVQQPAGLLGVLAHGGDRYSNPESQRSPVQ